MGDPAQTIRKNCIGIFSVLKDAHGTFGVLVVSLREELGPFCATEGCLVVPTGKFQLPTEGWMGT